MNKTVGDPTFGHFSKRKSKKNIREIDSKASGSLDRYVTPERRRVGHTALAFLRVIGLASTLLTLGLFFVVPVVSAGVLLKKDPSRKWVPW